MGQLNAIMEKEMTRKEFLTTLGFGLASVMGFSSVLKLLFSKGQQHTSVVKHVGAGYGSSAYGGRLEG